MGNTLLSIFRVPVGQDYARVTLTPIEESLCANTKPFTVSQAVLGQMLRNTSLAKTAQQILDELDKCSLVQIAVSDDDALLVACYCTNPAA